MNEVVQRWANVPENPMPLRRRRALDRGHVGPVLAFVERQKGFSASVGPWLSERALGYQNALNISEREANGEAALDLIAWHRRQPDPRQNAEFIFGHERYHAAQ